MAAIQQGRSPVVAIMPTGGSKSMLFTLLAWAVPGGTTVVVVPLISLRQDMARRCRQLGVSCVAWDRQRPPDEAAIVLVTLEAAVTGDFQSVISRLVKMRRLDRVVLDECHIIMNPQKHFRPQMAQLGRLFRARCPMVYFANTVRQAQAMAEAFGCEAYHSKQVDRMGVLERFIQGITDVITTTNALGMGVDILDIRVIFHIGMPRTLLDYAQESGRAGWDSQVSEAIITQLLHLCLQR